MMRSLARSRDALARLSGFLRRSTMERRLAEEMQFHIEMQTEENVRAGMAPEEARRAALVAFGGRERFREDARDEYRSLWLEELVRDVRHAVRGLRRTPAFTAAVVLSLALGIGATSAIFTVVERVVLRPLGYGDGGALVMLWSRSVTQPDERGVVSYADYLDWAQQSRTIQRAAAFNPCGATLSGAGAPEIVNGACATADFFRVLGVRPLLGRTFRPEEDVRGGPAVAVISYSLWQRHFGGDPDILGRTIGDAPYAIIGVMPPGFRDPESFYGRTSDVWLSFSHFPGPRSRVTHYLRAVARLRPGVSVDAAQRDLDVVAARLAKAYPLSDSARTVAVVSMREQIIGPSRPVLFAAMAGAACLLLIVCGNVATLIIARNDNRAGELAVRGAIGAGRARLARMLFVESITLAVVGGVLGTGLASIGVGFFRRFAPHDLPRVNEIVLDGRVLAVTAASVLLASILFGLVPALRASRTDLGAVLHAAARRSTSRGRLRNVVIVGQFALSLVLLSAAGLLTRTLLRLNAIPLGFSDAHVLTMQLSLPMARYETDSSRLVFFRPLMERLNTVPGVQVAGMTSSLPLSGRNDMVIGIPVTESRVGNARDRSPVHLRMVTPGYRRAMGVRLLAGRDFTDADSTGTQPVVIINHTAAAKFFPHEDPIGAMLVFDSTAEGRLRVVGVVDDVRFDGPAAPSAPEVFLPEAQAPFGQVFVVMRTSGTASRIIPAVQQIIRSMDPDLPRSDIRTMASQVAGFTARQRFYATLFAVFGFTALALAAVGVYGVIAYLVVRQRHEIGVRMALGARPRHVLAHLMGRVALLVALGAVIGVLAAVQGARALASLLYDVQPGDIPTLVASVALLAAVALAAAVVPALRATRIDPADAFRSE